MPLILVGAFFALEAWRKGWPRHSVTAFLHIVLVGIGSCAFHSTMLYECQLMDELPMLFLVCHLFYCSLYHCVIVEIEKGRKGQRSSALCSKLVSFVIEMDGNKRWLMGLTCIMLPGLVSGAYVGYFYNQPEFFQRFFGLILCQVVVQVYYRLWNTPALTTLRPYAFRTLIIFALSWLAWNMDTWICHDLRYIRENLLPWFLAPMLELHAWWHIGSALVLPWVIYTIIQVTHHPSSKRIARYEVEGEPGNFEQFINDQRKLQVETRFYGILPKLNKF